MCTLASFITNNHTSHYKPTFPYNQPDDRPYGTAAATEKHRHGNEKQCQSRTTWKKSGSPSQNRQGHWGNTSGDGQTRHYICAPPAQLNQWLKLSTCVPCFPVLTLEPRVCVSEKFSMLAPHHEFPDFTVQEDIGVNESRDVNFLLSSGFSFHTKQKLFKNYF